MICVGFFFKADGLQFGNPPTLKIGINDNADFYSTLAIFWQALDRAVWCKCTEGPVPTRFIMYMYIL